MAVTTATPPTVATPSTVDVKDARALFDEMIESSGKIDTRVVIERDGVVVGAFIPVEDVRGLARLDVERAEVGRVLAAMRAPFEGVPVEEIEREGAKAVAEVKAERAARRKAQSAA